MAKQTKRVVARKAKTKAKTKAPKKLKAATKKKAASRPVSTKPKRQKAKTGGKRSGVKKSAKMRLRNPVLPNPLQTETTIVDVVEEPVPGVFVVTEFVETHASTPDIAKQLDVNRRVGPEAGEK